MLICEFLDEFGDMLDRLDCGYCVVVEIFLFEVLFFWLELLMDIFCSDLFGFSFWLVWLGFLSSFRVFFLGEFFEFVIGWVGLLLDFVCFFNFVFEVDVKIVDKGGGVGIELFLEGFLCFNMLFLLLVFVVLFLRVSVRGDDVILLGIFML